MRSMNDEMNEPVNGSGQRVEPQAWRNVSVAAALALLVVGSLFLASGRSVAAAGPGAQLRAQGWWWQAQDGRLPAPLPPPPNVQKGQLNVQGNPSGKAAFAALRYSIEANHTVSSLTLKVGASGDQGGSAAVLLACRTGSAWTPAEAGAWSAAPTVDDKYCINGQRAADGSSWSFAISSLQLATVLDIAIVPGVDPATKQTSTFSLVFDAPSEASLVTVAEAPPTVPAAPSNPVSNNTPDGSGSPGSSAGPVRGTFRAPAPVAPIATGLPAEKIGETATSPANQAATAPALDTALARAPQEERNRAAGYVVLLSIAAVALYAWRHDNPTARNGGSARGALAEAGGLGRFSRPREGQPPALS